MSSLNVNAETPGRKPIIGLLGAPGSGKSLVARQLAALGCAVIDADVLAKEALDELAVREQLVAWWGPGVLDDAGRVDRQAVGRIVFSQPQELRKLESLTHPRVHDKRAALHEKYQADPAIKAIVEDCPLLLEKQLEGGCDVLVYVDAPWDVRVERVRQGRGWSAQELERREKNQMPLDIKRKRADYVVSNAASEASTYDEVRRVLSQILQNRN